jgi:hypothetical protein
VNAPIHYLSSNDSTWTPPAIISLDTETRVIQEYPEVQEMRCWHVRADYRIGNRRLNGEHVEGAGVDATDLARRIGKWADRWAETWVYAHNLNFDLTVTRLPLLLASNGWEVTDMALDGNRPWMILKHDNRKLVITDSYSIWPTKLEEIGDAMGIAKPPLPENDDLQTWIARCAADTLILHTALLTVMNWHDANQLGRWALTGASTGWNTMRHLQAAKTSKQARTARTALGMPAVDPAAQPVVIDPDDNGRTNDRLAIYGGRRETWRWGKLQPGIYHELDFERAYQTIMAHCALPRKRGRWFENLPLDSRLIDDPCCQWGIIAECEIDTDVPRWPCRVTVPAGHAPPGPDIDPVTAATETRTRVFYPIGRFRTVLAGPDIAEARRLGCLRSVGRGQVHQLGYAARPWAAWSMTAQDDQATPAVVRLALKHQGRAVAGKWAARTWTKSVIGFATTYGWSYEDVYIHETQTRGAIIDLAGTKFLSIPGTDSDNAYPAVLAWIESYTRVALARAIEDLGADRMIQCDTDGMIVDTTSLASRTSTQKGATPEGEHEGGALARALAELASRTSPLRLRAKTAYRSIEVIGPQHLTLDGTRRWSGLPGSADKQPDGSYAAMTWPKLAWQLANGDPRGYTRVVQTYRLANSYAPGWLLTDGTVAPPEARIAGTGQTVLVTWPETRYAARGCQLSPGQPTILTTLAGS